MEKFDVGDEVSNFSLDSQIGRYSFLDAIDGKWCILVTFGLAFDPVATTDLGMLAKLADEFEARNIVILALGCDSGLFVCFHHKDVLHVFLPSLLHIKPMMIINIIIIS